MDAFTGRHHADGSSAAGMEIESRWSRVLDDIRPLRVPRLPKLNRNEGPMGRERSRRGASPGLHEDFTNGLSTSLSASRLSLQILGVEGDVLWSKGRDKVVRVIKSVLQSDFDLVLAPSILLRRFLQCLWFAYISFEFCHFTYSCPSFKN